ncbi:alkaline phosphatase D family protein [Streptomyces clavifer]|uniref:alkaline phosphatase D family protein n=1 Tax=Streptomyces TaxID=1883 RepID=UPI0006FC1852|nr:MULTISPECIES: alkaline phosphatase D family protein [unclassified Streptomyces]KQX79218.1 alkaline phosphatase [Streptomyces sp. Root1319]KQZ21264.1 alkaline phosphatase [Streptomyces sp. Root55]
MAGLRLGPLLRYVDWETGSRATVWVETTRPCTALVRCADGSSGASPTFAVEGHHYALVVVTGLTPGSSTAYEVLLDGRRAWPLEGSRFPPSTITTPAVPQPEEAGPVRIAFGSCRWAAPPAGGHDLSPGSRLRSSEEDAIGPDALDTLAARLAADPTAVRPDVLLLLGDQVYADETSKATRQRIAARRDLGEPPGAEVADYEEYTHLYDESWRDPDVRWLLSTVPSCMIFDDHDVIDDWNTSGAWLEDMRRTPWWHERIVSGLMSYWVYQHLGNLSPDALAADPLYAAVRAAPDATETLRRHAAEADADPAGTRWSYRRVFGRVRLLMVDTRAARVLDEQERSMLDAGEARWLRDEVLTDRAAYDHLLIGTSLPWLLPPLVHHAETWNAALCRGERGGPDGRWARIGEKVRRACDLEHWAAFPESFRQLSELLREAGRGPDAPATVCVLSGDVHHAYIAEPRWSDSVPDDTSGARILQLTCSPVHNSIPATIRTGFRLGWSRAGRWLGRGLALHGRTGAAPMDWRKTGGPWFGNQLMTLTLHGRKAVLTLVQARERPTGAQLETVLERTLTSNE